MCILHVKCVREILLIWTYDQYASDHTGSPSFEYYESLLYRHVIIAVHAGSSFTLGTHFAAQTFLQAWKGQDPQTIVQVLIMYCSCNIL